MIDFLLDPALGQGGIVMMLTIAQNLGLAILILVLAKRYLCFTDPTYQPALSASSKHTLVFQGGPMTAAEAKAFESGPLFEICAAMRRWDEAAKDPEAVVPGVASYRALLEGVLRAQ